MLQTRTGAALAEKALADRIVFSAKDKAILESAYNANPKPDKAARLDIVKRVSLNEKEVQVRPRPGRCHFWRVYNAINRTHGSRVKTNFLLTSCPVRADMVSKPPAERQTQVASPLSPGDRSAAVRQHAGPPRVHSGLFVHVEPTPELQPLDCS